MYKNETLKKYLDDLAAKLPAPGGGSAAALTGASGCALLSMVCNFTIGKDKYKDVEEKVKDILKESESARKRFLQLVDLDVSSYYKVFNSRKKAPGVYQKNLVASTKVPLEICELSVAAYKLCPFLAERANKYLISDVYVGKELLKSAFKSGEFNVKINLPEILDKEFILKTQKELKKLKGQL